MLLPFLRSGTEMVRVRNALSLGETFDPANDWQPPAFPPGFLREHVAPDPFFVAIADGLGLPSQADDWTRALLIGRHLQGSAGQLVGNPLYANLRNTYRGIVERGGGYCGDFVRVYIAIANAAGMTVRPLAFSFDGFGGHGHIWVEVWNRQLLRWQLVDVYNNAYYTAAGEPATPLSALALRDALLAGGSGLAVHRIHDGRPPGFEVESKGWAYLQRGIHHWYLPWGANVMSVDASPAVRLLAPVSRGLEQLAGILTGVQPRVHLLVEAANASDVTWLRAVRVWVWLAALLGAVGAGLLLFAPRARPAVRSPVDAAAAWPRLCIVGPLPPPSGGMANQCEQLLRLLREAGAEVIHVRTNAPYRPAWIGRFRGVRALFRLLPYLAGLWTATGRAEVVHVFANSGWAWHLLAAPAVLIARWRRTPVIVNYRGGQADEFLSRAPSFVKRTLSAASLLVTPSTFLQRVFARHGLTATIVPNIIDLARFSPRPLRRQPADPHLIVTRNLEPLYDIPNALRAFALIRRVHPGARLTVAGSGPELAALRSLARELGIDAAVTFSGRIDNADIPALYAGADLMLNPTTADNMPISILEALACGVPVVSTDAGGIPDLVQHGRTALLVPVGDSDALAQAALRVLGDPTLAARLHEQGLSQAAGYTWPRVSAQWLKAYRQVMKGGARPRRRVRPAGADADSPLHDCSKLPPTP